MNALFLKLKKFNPQTLDLLTAKAAKAAKRRKFFYSFLYFVSFVLFVVNQFFRLLQQDNMRNYLWRSV